MIFTISGHINGGEGETAVMLTKLAEQVLLLGMPNKVTMEGDGVQVTAVFESPCIELLEMEPQPVINGSLVFWNGFIWTSKGDDDPRADDGPSRPSLHKMITRCYVPDVDGKVEKLGIKCLGGRWYWRVEWFAKSN